MNTLFQPRWRAWIAGAIVLAVAIVLVLAIVYSGGGGGGGGYCRPPQPPGARGPGGAPRPPGPLPCEATPPSIDRGDEQMTSKADFTDEEWTLLREAPTSAGMLVVQADKGGMFRETFSMGKAYTEARKQHGASQLLDDIVSEKPKVDRAHTSSQEELRANLLQHIRDAIALRGGKGTPEEVEEYRRFMMGLANRVAEAHREGGEEPVSDAERQTIAEIAQAAGASESA